MITSVASDWGCLRLVITDCVICVFPPQAIQQSKELEISPDLLRVRRVDNPELWVLPPEDKVPPAPVHINSSLRPDVPVFVPGQRYTLPGKVEN